jgi:predicted nucleic acid-binding protein
MVYLDSSALVKLIVSEPESGALRRYLRPRPARATCALSRVEVVRAVRHHGVHAVTRARLLLQRLDVVRLDDELLERAAALEPPTLRSLDAIHLAAAQTLGDELAEIVTYDERMTNAAEQLGLIVAAPR